MALFSKDDLQDEVHDTIYDKIVDSGRWTLKMERVFRHEGRFYKTTYTVGATELQDTGPYDYAPDEIECPEVFPVEKVITVYEEKK